MNTSSASLKRGWAVGRGSDRGERVSGERASWPASHFQRSLSFAAAASVSLQFSSPKFASIQEAISFHVGIQVSRGPADVQGLRWVTIMVMHRIKLILFLFSQYGFATKTQTQLQLCQVLNPQAFSQIANHPSSLVMLDNCNACLLVFDPRCMHKQFLGGDVERG